MLMNKSDIELLISRFRMRSDPILCVRIEMNRRGANSGIIGSSERFSNQTNRFNFCWSGIQVDVEAFA